MCACVLRKFCVVMRFNFSKLYFHYQKKNVKTIDGYMDFFWDNVNKWINILDEAFKFIINYSMSQHLIWNSNRKMKRKDKTKRNESERWPNQAHSERAKLFLIRLATRPDSMVQVCVYHSPYDIYTWLLKCSKYNLYNRIVYIVCACVCVYHLKLWKKWFCFGIKGGQTNRYTQSTLHWYTKYKTKWYIF